MVRRWNAEDTHDLRIPAHANRAMTVAENRAVRWVVFKTHQLKAPIDVRPLDGTDPGPAGFNWVEIDLKRTH